MALEAIRIKLVFLAAAWIAGLLIGLEGDVHLPALIAFSVAALALGILLRIRSISVQPALLVLVLLMALIRVEVGQGPRPLLTSDSSRPFTVRGLVISDPERSGTLTEFVLSIDCLDRGDGCEESTGKLLVRARPTAELVQRRDEPYFRYGDELELTGKLEEAPALGNFDYGAYLENQGIHATMSHPQVRLLASEGRGNPALRLIYRVRREVSGGIDRALPEAQSSLAQALLLGLRGGIPQEITEDFRSSGTSHLLAISGLHVGVLLALSLGAAAWLMGRRRQLYLLLPLVAIWLYALVSGLSPSVERAAIMGSV